MFALKLIFCIFCSTVNKFFARHHMIARLAKLAIHKSSGMKKAPPDLVSGQEHTTSSRNF
jgi:hypothetical protein